MWRRPRLLGTSRPTGGAARCEMESENRAGECRKLLNPPYCRPAIQGRSSFAPGRGAGPLISPHPYSASLRKLVLNLPDAVVVIIRHIDDDIAGRLMHGNAVGTIEQSIRAIPKSRISVGVGAAG